MEQCLTCLRPQAIVMINCRPLCGACGAIVIRRLTPLPKTNVVDFAIYKLLDDTIKELKVLRKKILEEGLR